jgi:hypothetical protein
MEQGVVRSLPEAEVLAAAREAAQMVKAAVAP